MSGAGGGFEDCFAIGDQMLPVEEALALLHERVQPLIGQERVPLGQAQGRVLAEDLIAAFARPEADNAAVDGYAFAASDLVSPGPTHLALTGRAAAGRALEGAWRPGAAVRVFTGALLPAGCDTVAMQEEVAREGEQVLIPSTLKRGANRRRTGEDFAAGARLLEAGCRLRPQEIALAAAAGRTELAVHRQIRVALFSTGDELSEPDGSRGGRRGRVFDANRYLLGALLSGPDVRVSDLGILPDRRADVSHALAAAARSHDLLLTSGGVSAGEEDHVRAAVESLGRLHFWRLAMKPGRPLVLGQIEGAIFLGLPGNPVAAMVCFLLFCRPLLDRLAGAPALPPRRYPVIADFTYAKKAGRREWLRGHLVEREGRLLARPFPRQGSGIISSLVESDGLIELADEVTAVAPGAILPFLPFGTAAGAA